jgi:2-polyprenyl-3-methyl-5-hydroxy-6-metoxy-1,4-benzoquinol methylase
MIDAAGIPKVARVIDVGGGASTLADYLVERGFSNLTVLDISQASIDVARVRLGARAASVTWLIHDATAFQPEMPFDLWHDRAVFHFLVEEQNRRAYLQAMAQALRPGSWVILATFALTGPEQCSGLPIQRYSTETLQATLGVNYRLAETQVEQHRTPSGKVQDFVWCLFQKIAGA